MADYEVREDVRAEVPVVTVRESVPANQISTAIGRIFSEVFDYVISRGAEAVGAPFARYHSMSEDAFDVEAGFVVDRPLPSTGRFISSVLPSGTTAVTWHIGPYENVGHAYEALEEWMKEHGMASAGSPWEAYWTDPNQEPDPANWRTEVIWPLQEAA